MHRRIATLMACWGGIALCGAGLLIPKFIERARLTREIGTLRAELAKPVDGPEVVDRLTSDLASLREIGKGRMTPIPAEADVAGLMGSLSDSIEKMGLKSRDMTTRTVKETGDVSALPLTTVMDGSFADVARAIEAIESMPRLLRIDRLRVTTTGDQGAATHDGTVRAEVSIEVYFADAAASEERKAVAP